VKQSSGRILQTGHATGTTGYQNVSQKHREVQATKRKQLGGTLQPGQQNTKLSATGRLPSPRFRQHGVKELCRERRRRTEGSSIPFFPKQPANQEDQGVEAPPQRFRHQLVAPDPPKQHPFFRNDDHILQLQLRQPNEPHLSTEAAAKQNVIQNFQSLIAHNAFIRLLQLMSEPPVPVQQRLWRQSQKKKRTRAGATAFQSCLAAA